MKDKKNIRNAINNAPIEMKASLTIIFDQICEEEKCRGAFKSIDDFIDRMMAASMDLHAFTVIGNYLPITFCDGGKAFMLRNILLLRNIDPDYAVSPEIEGTTIKKQDYPNDEDIFDDLPFC